MYKLPLLSEHIDFSLKGVCRALVSIRRGLFPHNTGGTKVSTPRCLICKEKYEVSGLFNLAWVHWCEDSEKAWYSNGFVHSTGFDTLAVVERTKRTPGEERQVLGEVIPLIKESGLSDRASAKRSYESHPAN